MDQVLHAGTDDMNMDHAITVHDVVYAIGYVSLLVGVPLAVVGLFAFLVYLFNPFGTGH
jgi:hypothetical protein